MLLSGDVAVYMEIVRKIYSAVFEFINYKQTNKHTNIFLFYRYRWSKEFLDPLVCKQLYISFVRCILEYGSVIWDPGFILIY